MAALSWLDRLIFGRDAVERSDAAERRYQAALAAHRKNHEDIEEGRQELARAVKTFAEEVQKVAEQVPVVGLATAVQELAGDEGIVDDDSDRAPGPRPPSE